MVASSLAVSFAREEDSRAMDAKGMAAAESQFLYSATPGVQGRAEQSRVSLQRETLFHTCSVPGGGFPLNEEEEAEAEEVEEDWLRVSLSLPFSPSRPARSV